MRIAKCKCGGTFKITENPKYKIKCNKCGYENEGYTLQEAADYWNEEQEDLCWSDWDGDFF